MNILLQNERAENLRSLHTGDDLLLMPNVWNPIGARILAAKGYPAVATASAALSASLGYADGEKLQRSTLIEFLRRIAFSVDVPVTADIEAGYGNCLSELQETIQLVLESGAVGINIEDSLREGCGLRPIEEQCQRILAVRQVGDSHGIQIVINARVDSFSSSAFPDKQSAIKEATVRAKAYAEAGADCIYPIGPGDEATVRILREKIPYPINILASPAAAPLSVLQEIGVNRVSFGPLVFRSCLRSFVDIIEDLRANGNYAWFSETMSGAEVGAYLRNEHE